MQLQELKDRYTFYVNATKDQIAQAKYHQGFAYKKGNLEDVLEENEAMLELIGKIENN